MSSEVKSEKKKCPARKASKRSLRARFTIVKTCVMCGKKFATDSERDMFCSFKCRDEKNAEYVKTARAQFRRRRETHCERFGRVCR